MLRATTILTLSLALFVTACGGGTKGDGGGTPPSDAVQNVPSENGVRENVKKASTPTKADFPPAKGATLQELADKMAAGPSLALASSVFTTPGDSRMAFGMIAADGTPVYGPTAIYVAPTPTDPAEGPFVAPADVLLTDARYRSKQAATTTDPFVAVYGADVKFAKKGKYAVLGTTKLPNGSLTGATGQIDVSTTSADPIPNVGDKAPKVHTDTLESAKGDVSKIDTRVPPSDMHAVDFADVVGKKPVALLFATPQLCQSRVCGPVVDVGLQLRSRYGDQVEFIHQEVYTDNDPNKGLRKPLQQFGLPTEPWLFVVGKDGTITARLEGSFGLGAFEQALKTAL
jgi:hypothetical protein